MTLWTGAEAAAATGGEARGDWDVNGVSIDTRTLQAGDLFVALTAARDGHEFVAQALDKGAGAALVSHVPKGVPQDAPLLIVDDVQAGLEALGRAARARTDARVVAVTGSVGKTSTKEMLARMLGDQGRTHASIASYNNHWGVPLTLARMPRDTEYAVIEIGMNHPGEIAPLARMARPHVALVTIVAPAHLEAFENVEGIAREKVSICEGLEPGGTAILNADLDEFKLMADIAEPLSGSVIGFGQKTSDYKLLKISVEVGSIQVEATSGTDALNYCIQSAGRHFAMNGLGALAAVTALGADRLKAVDSLANWTPYQGRGALETIVVPGGDITLLDDSYNANPASMASALDVLSVTAAPAGRRIAFLGDMKELGPQAEALHAGIARLPALEHIDVVHCIGPLMQALHLSLPDEKRGVWADSSAELAAQIPDLLSVGDVVLAKGSLSMKLALIVDAIRKMGQVGPT